MSLTEILDEVARLTAEERQQIVCRVRELDEPLAMTDERRAELYRRLIAKGMLKRIPPRLNLPRDFEPIEIEGKPISETIIEERR